VCSLAVATQGVAGPDHTHAALIARVVYVADGDTIVIDTGPPAGGAAHHVIQGVPIYRYERVRFVGGINAPEVWGARAGMPEAHAYEARWAIWQLLAGQEVRLALRPERPRDDFGRLLAYIYVLYRGDWILANAEVIRRGLGRLDPRFHLPEDRYYEYLWQMQIEALVARRGVWGRFPQTLTVEEIIVDPVKYLEEAVTVQFVVTEVRVSRRPPGLYIHGESPRAINFRLFIPEKRAPQFEQLGMGRDFWQSGMEVTVTGVALWDRGLLITLESPLQLADLPVQFADPGLERAIRGQIAKPSGPIFRGDLVGLTTLAAEGRGIADLGGIEHLVNLRVVRLAQNCIQDLTPLRALRSLEELSLSRNRIRDVRPLAELTRLRLLVLSANQISDLSPLAHLTQLTELYAAENNIGDASPVAALVRLQRLDLSANRIADIAALAALTELTHLELADNQIKDLTALSGLGALRLLHLDRNPLATLAPLSALTELEELLLGWTGISDLSPLARLTGLERLSLGWNQISDIGPLSGLVRLEQLWLYWNQIGDITALANLTRLNELALRSNQITDIAALTELIELEWLCLSMNRIQDITALAGLTQIKELSLSYNRIVDIAPLVANAGLGAGDTLFVGNNLLDETPGSPAAMAVATLLRRGVSVR
jgi:Leucine-rich repeat (LRR) protein/endonuclease YncB( thermonuclease family)